VSGQTSWRILDPDGAEIPFSSLTVASSLEQLASTARWRTHTPRRDLLNQQVRIVEDDEPRFVGYLEQIDGDALSGYDVGARSSTSTLLLYDADGSEVFSATSIRAVLESLALRVGIKVAPGTPEDRVSRFRLTKGENFAQGIQRFAETYRFVATDDALGRLVAYRTLIGSALETWRDRTGSVTGAITSRLDVSEWRKEWLCRGQRELVDDDAADEAAQIGLGVDTLSIRPTRRIVANKSATSQAHARQLVTWQAQKALANVQSLTVHHDRWPTETGELVRVVVPTESINEDFVVQAVTATIGAGQVSATAICVLPDVYTTQPRPPRNIESRAMSAERKLANALQAQKGAK
jgi:hypothetical protein